MGFRFRGRRVGAAGGGARRAGAGAGVARVMLLVAVVCAGWALGFGKWTPRSLTRPIAYSYDAMFNLGVVKSAADFAYLPIVSKTNPRLGAPHVAVWDDFPHSDDHVYFLTGLLARPLDPVAAVNVGLLVASLAAALCFYGVARHLRTRWELALVAAALFGLAPYLFYRNAHHLNVCFYWHVPLLLLAWLKLGRTHPVPWRVELRRVWPLAIIGLIAGIHYVYYLNYFLQGVGLLLVFHLLRRDFRKTGAVAIVMAAALAGFVVSNLDTLRYTAAHGPNRELAQRDPYQLEMFALKPVELVTPGPWHRWGEFARIGKDHRSRTLASGEFPSAYLGIVGAAGFIGLLVHSMYVYMAPGVRRTALSRLGVLCVWLMLVGVVGGTMHLLHAVLGRTLWRANNRVSVFLLCAALLFLARYLTPRSRRERRWAVMVAAVGVLVLGVWDQTPRPRIGPTVPAVDRAPEMARMAASDARLVAQLEEILPAGSGVFQLPPMKFPESGGVEQVPDHDHFRPYLWSRHLRFSYGNIKGRPPSRWQFHVSRMPPEEMLRELEANGFGAIYIHRGGYSEAALDALVRSLADLGRSRVLHGEYGDTLVVLLEPSAPSAPPSVR